MKLFRNIKPFFIDERGKMTYILPMEIPVRSVLLITCKKDSVRANHWHKKDRHYAYMLSGSMEYAYKKLSGKKISRIIVHTGEVVYTPPGEIHKMTFLEDSEFLAMTTEKRVRKLYERDTVKVKI